MKLTTRIAYSIFPSRVWEAMIQEWPLTKLRWKNSLLPSRRRLKLRMAKLRDYRLHLGCGRRVMEGWVNVDCFAAEGIAFEGDLREPLPFSDSSAKMLYSEHVIEHLLPHEASHFLCECHRMLQPGGIIRLGVPDAELYLRAYVSEDAAFFETAKNIGSPVSPLDTPMKIINQMARMGGHHHFAWDFQTLQLEMERAGFRQVTKGQPGSSAHNGLCLDDPSHAFETLYAEATKM